MRVQGGFGWRHDPKKLEKWLKAFEYPVTSPRKVSKIVGVLVWDVLIRLKSLQTIVPEVNVLRGAVKGVKSKQDWDRLFSEKDQQHINSILTEERLQGHLARLKENRWQPESHTY